VVFALRRAPQRRGRSAPRGGIEQLVERAVGIVEAMGARVIGPDEVRAKLKVEKRAPA